MSWNLPAGPSYFSTPSSFSVTTPSYGYSNPTWQQSIQGAVPQFKTFSGDSLSCGTSKSIYNNSIGGNTSYSGLLAATDLLITSASLNGQANAVYSTCTPHQVTERFQISKTNTGYESSNTNVNINSMSGEVRAHGVKIGHVDPALGFVKEVTGLNTQVDVDSDW